jgi:hypothetical protein
MLHTGEVVAWAYPGPNQAKVWNPDSNTFMPVNMSDDIFCSGQSQLPDGRIFVSGGNASGCEYKGIIDTNIFDPITKTWSAQPNMTNGRWYPTNVTMPDGRVLIFSGLNLTCITNTACEMFTPNQDNPNGTLSLVPEGSRSLSLYPRMHILSDGRIAHVGSENSAWTFELGEGWTHIDNNNFGWRSQGTSVLLPGFTDRIMAIGGGSNPVTATCEIIDFTQPSPQWAYTTPMHHARAHANATILPDKTVLVVGGGQNGLYGSPVLTPELYDPAAQTWTLLPSIVHGRMYHSTSILLPDGRVLVAGQDNGPGQTTAEIYSPRYLFRGERPEIQSTVQQVAFNQAFSIQTLDASDVTAIHLIKLTTVTHSVNFEQRLLELDFEMTAGNLLAAVAPAHANLAPPGYYMLFLMNGNDVPSIAKIIRVSDEPTADVDGSGDVNVDDLLAVINAWGTCESPCIADVTADGNVDVNDLLHIINGWG